MIRKKQIKIIKSNSKGWNWKKYIQNKIYLAIKSLRTKFDIISK